MLLSADVTMKKAEEEKPEFSLSIEKPIRPVHPVRPIVNTGVVYQDNYYTESYNTDCGGYLEIIAKKDAIILSLQKELHALKSKEQKQLQQTLKAQYDEEMKKFEKSQNSIKTKNSITISKEPI